MKEVVFIGAGKLATNVAHALHQSGVKIRMVYSRTASSAETLAQMVEAEAVTTIEQVNRLVGERADMALIYALTDTALPDIVSQVHAPNAHHFHTAGSMPISVFELDKPHAGVFYPFQGFSKEKLVDFSQVNLFLSARDAETETTGRELANAIGAHVMLADDDTRCRIHLAGVLTNNFITCLCGIAAEQLKKGDIPFEVMYSLLDDTIGKVKRENPRSMQSGPAIRKDESVMQKHLELLSDEPDVAELYRLFSQNIMAHS